MTLNAKDYKQKYEEFWSKQGLHTFYGYERNKVLSSFFEKPGKLLDLGCGDGVISEFLQERGFDVYSLDISYVALLKAKERRGLSKCILADSEHIPFRDETFDIVFLGDIIEHLYFSIKTLNEVHRVMKEKAKVVISFPNMSYWRYRLYYLLHGNIPRTEGSKNEPWNWEHIRFFNRQAIKNMLEVSSFVLEKVTGVSRGKYEAELATKIDLFASMLVIRAKKVK